VPSESSVARPADCALICLLLSYFFYYGATIFQSVGISDSFITQIILGAVNFVSTFGGLYIMEKFGRRWPLILGGLWMSLWLFVFACIGVTRDVANDKAAGSRACCSPSLEHVLTSARP
jgi:SP family sugar:H+ symporter-like MFS transporter